MNRRNFIKKLFVGAAAVAVVPLLPEAAPYPKFVSMTTEWVTAEIGQWEGFRWVSTPGNLYFTNISDPDNFGTVLDPSDLDEIN